MGSKAALEEPIKLAWVTGGKTGHCFPYYFRTTLTPRAEYTVIILSCQPVSD